MKETLKVGTTDFFKTVINKFGHHIYFLSSTAKLYN